MLQKRKRLAMPAGRADHKRFQEYLRNAAGRAGIFAPG